jgi:hypothetical protein
MGQVQRRSDEDGEDDLGLGSATVPGLVLGGLEDLDAEDELVYDLDDWSERDLAVLRERLETLAVPHRWEGPSLVVAASDEAWLERIFDQVDDDLSLALDPDVEQIAYDLSSWEPERRDALLEALVDEAVPHGWDGDELYVHEIDEQRVDELIDAALDPDTGPAQGGEGDGQRAMGELFVAADRLRSDPNHHEATLALVDGARLAATAPTPYGIEQRWWDEMVAAAGGLAALLESGTAVDEDVAAAAGELRDRLRPLV